jgi:HAMP domain
MMPMQRRTNIFVVALVVLGIALIAGAGYSKFKLDQTEAELRNPTTRTSVQEALKKAHDSLGYAGFMSAYHTYTETRSEASFLKMQETLNNARTTASELSLIPGAEAAHQALRGILKEFETATKLLENFSPPSSTALMVSLTWLASQIQEEQGLLRQEAMQRFESYSKLLVLLTAVSVVTFISLLCGIWLYARREIFRPIEEMTQGLHNIVGGDDTSPAPGSHRTDAFGDLARAINAARDHFYKMPHLTLASDAGPVRLRFQGQSQSLFEAVMSQLGQETSFLKDEAGHLARFIADQRQFYEGMNADVVKALSHIQNTGTNADGQMKMLTNMLTQSAAYMQKSQEDLLVRLGRLVPQLQDRVANMNSITEMAGKQMTQSLQSLGVSESALKKTVVNSENAALKLKEMTDDLSVKLHHAVNTLRTSGTTLQETTESAKANLQQVASSLAVRDKALDAHLVKIIERAKSTTEATENIIAIADRSEKSAHKLETSTSDVLRVNHLLREQMTIANNRFDLMMKTVETQQKSFAASLDKATMQMADTDKLVAELRLNQSRLTQEIKSRTGEAATMLTDLVKESSSLLSRISDQWQNGQQSLKMQIEHMVNQNHMLTMEATSAAQKLIDSSGGLYHEQRKIAEARGQLEQHIALLGPRLDDKLEQSFTKIIMTTDGVVAKLDDLDQNAGAIVQKLSVLGQLTSTLGGVAGMLGQLTPQIAGNLGHPLLSEKNGMMMSATADTISELRQDMLAAIAALPHKFVTEWATPSTETSLDQNAISHAFGVLNDKIDRSLSLLTTARFDLAKMTADKENVPVADLVQNLLRAIDRMSGDMQDISDRLGSGFRSLLEAQESVELEIAKHSPAGFVGESSPATSNDMSPVAATIDHLAETMQTIQGQSVASHKTHLFSAPMAEGDLWQTEERLKIIAGYLAELMMQANMVMDHAAATGELPKTGVNGESLSSDESGLEKATAIVENVMDAIARLNAIAAAITGAVDKVESQRRTA